MPTAASDRASPFPVGTKILITGGSGHLGSALVHHLVGERGVPAADIRIFYLAGSPTRSLDDVPGLDHRPGDILDSSSVEDACRGIELVFHMAASTSFDPAQKARQWRINVDGTRHVLDAVRRSPSIRRLCYTSTVNVLGVPRPKGSIGRLENCDPYSGRRRLHSFSSSAATRDFIERARIGRPGWSRGVGIGYFDSKLAAQELVSQYVLDFGVDAVSVLPGTLFGPYDALVGSGIFLLQIHRRRLPGVLKGGISAVHVMDAAEGHVLAMTRGRKGGRYILAGNPEDQVRFREMALVISDVLGRLHPERKVRRRYPLVPTAAAMLAAAAGEFASKRTGRPCLLSRGAVRAGSRLLFYSADETAAAIGYRPTRSFRKAVEDMAAYYEGQGLFDAAGRQTDQKKQ